MNPPLFQAFFNNFMGQSPSWYKTTVIAFLIINPVLFSIHPFTAGWLLIVQFIFTLAMALKCYPLQPGGLIALESVAIGMVTPETVYLEVSKNLEVILLLVFMVAGIYFMKQLLLFVFTKIVVGVKSKRTLSLLFSLVAAALSAFLDALTVTAVIIAVAVGFYAVYHKVASGKLFHQDHNHGNDIEVKQANKQTLNEFRAFLRSLLMHGAIGTALGGVCTQVGEPQNLLIADRLGWNFVEFFVNMAPITMPVLAAGLLTCYLLEKTKKFGYGTELPLAVRHTLEEFASNEHSKMNQQHKAALLVQAVVATLLCLSLAFHIAEVGLIGLMVIILTTSFNGITEEHQIGKAFEDALPFTALLVVFFTIVGVIHEHHLFSGIINFVLNMESDVQPGMFFLANGVLSAISDNVFVATVYIDEVKAAFDANNISREHYEALAIAINAGTNLPSVATPNGQAAFLFLLTSAIAPLIRLSYGTMVWMALPYTVVMGGVGYLAVRIYL